jgi:uncharacterized SAM-binding protein YcdF (DUF218 family)
LSYGLPHTLWALAAPSRILELAAIVTCFWTIAGSHRTRVVACGVTGLIVFVAIAPTGYWLFALLETRFPPRQSVVQAPPYGIIALGGDSGHRLLSLARLSREFPDARLVYTGRGDTLAAAEEIRAAGIDPARITLETRSGNTFENAINTAKIVRPNPAELWLVITSGGHMPRAIGCFRHAGFNVIAYPVDLMTQGSPPPIGPQRMVQFDDAVREWTALVIYRLVGNTEVLFPGP